MYFYSCFGRLRREAMVVYGRRECLLFRNGGDGELFVDDE